jgi:hypothetical protein
MIHPESLTQAQHRRCRVAYGITPQALDLLVALMAHERLYGRGLTRKEAAELLNVTDVNAGPLIRLGWLIGDTTPAPNQVLSVTQLGWRKVWPWKLGWPPADNTRRSAAGSLTDSI